MKIIRRVVIGILVIQLGFLTYPVRAEVKKVAPMVQIAAEIVEVDNTKMNEVGIKWPEIMEASEMAPIYGTKAGETGVRYPILGSGDEVPLYSFHEMGKIRRLTELRATLKILEEKGAAHTMANPKLTTESGSTATFLAGGEIPVPVQQKDAISIEWKEYGVSLDIKPTVLANKKIRADVKASVTALDWANASLTSNTPALKTRTVSSRIAVDDGDTIVIAGLVQTKKEKIISGIPLLCRIPGIGLLFGRTKWVNNKTTVVIFITLSRIKKGAK